MIELEINFEKVRRNKNAGFCAINGNLEFSNIIYKMSNSVKSQESRSNSESLNFKNQDIFLESESDQSRSRSGSEHSSKQKIQNNFQFLQDRLATSLRSKPKTNEQPKKNTQRKNNRKNRSNPKPLLNRIINLPQNNSLNILKLQDEHIDLEQRKEQPNSGNSIQSEQDQEFVYSHFKIAKDRSKSQCNYCNMIFSFDNCLAFKSNTHVSQSHPQKINNHQNSNKNQNNQEFYQFKPDQSESDYFYPQFKVPKGRKSCVWEKFMFNQEIQVAVCKICKMAYKVKDGSTSGMLKHLALIKTQQGKNHKPSQIPNSVKKQEQSTNDKQLNQIIQQNKVPQQTKSRRPYKKRTKGNFIQAPAFQNNQIDRRVNTEEKQLKCIQLMEEQHLSITRHQLINVLTRYISLSKNQAIQIINKYYWAYETNYEKLFQKLSKLKGVKIRQNHLDGGIKNFCVFTDGMLSKYIEFGECLSVWVQKLNFPKWNVQQFIYLTAQNRAGRPVVVGLAILSKTGRQAYINLLKTLNEVLITTYFPQCITFGGDPNSCIEIKTIIDQFITQKKLPTKTITVTLSQNTDKLKQMLEKQRINHFVGFLLTKEHCKDIQFIMRISQVGKNSLNSCLHQFFWKLKYLQAERLVYKEDRKQSFDYYHTTAMKSLYFQALLDKNLMSISNYLSKRVFVKLLHLVVYSRSFIKLDKEVDKELSCSVSSAFPVIYPSQQPQQYTLKYNKTTSNWQCSCKLLQKIGLPCPHILYILNKFKGEILYYINSRWCCKQRHLMKQLQYHRYAQDLMDDYVDIGDVMINDEDAFWGFLLM